MLRVITLTYLFAIVIKTHCARVDPNVKYDDNMSTTSYFYNGDGDIYYRDDGLYHMDDKVRLTTDFFGAVDETTEFTKVLFKTKKWIRHTRTLTTNSEDLPTERADVIARIQDQLAKKRDKAARIKPDVIKTKKWAPYYRNFSVGLDVIPGRRTDVIAQLQEQRVRHGAKAFQPNDINYELPGEIWPAITFRIPKLITPFFIPTSLSKPTRTFRDHFGSVRLDFRPKYTANLDFLSSRKSDIGLSAPQNIATFSNNFLWRHTFLATVQPTWYAVYRAVPSTLKVPGPGNPGIINSLLSNDALTLSGLNATFNASTKPEVGEMDYFHAGYAEDLQRYYENYEYVRNRNAMSLPYPFNTGAWRAHETHKTHKTDKKLNTTNTTTTTTTTTTRTTRTYPIPQWICYECGRNETKFGSTFCKEVFDTEYGNMKMKQHSLRYRCNGNGSVAYQCFKRFVDVGQYNERGCRDWPPRRSGKTYASKRLRALEKVLHDTIDGCVFTPQAYLLSLSRSVQLYVRFHACVCNGTLCNGVSTISAGTWLVLIMLSIIGSRLLGRY